MYSLVIPAYNEENAIAETVTRALTVMKGWTKEPFEVIVVDDGSADKTAENADKAGARVIRSMHNVGYGFSLKTGISNAKYDVIAIMDGDGTYPIESLPDLFAKFHEGFDLVVGRRTGRHYRESMLKWPLRLIFKALVEFTVGHTIEDINSGLRVFSRKDVMDFFPHLSNRFSFTTSQTLAYFINTKFVCYLPIDYHKRVGNSKVKLFRDSLGALQMIASAILYFNPLKLFLAVSLLPLLISVVSFIHGVVFSSSLGYQFSLLSFLAALLIIVLGFLTEAMRQYTMPLNKPQK